MKQSLLYALIFILGIVSTWGFQQLTGARTPELDRVTIMRPVPHEAVPKPIEKITPVGDEKSTKDASPKPREALPDTAVRENGTVEFVYDGDTVRLADKRKIRLIGIDTPEMNYGKGAPECFANEAKKQLEALVDKKQVTLVADKEDKDRYGRNLRYMYIESPEGGVFVNAALVKSGAARAKRYAPNTTYASELETASNEAEAARRGLWGVCKK